MDASSNHSASATNPMVVSRRGFLGGGLSAMALSLTIKPGDALAQAAASQPQQNPFEAILELRQDGTAFLQIPFIEGGNGSFTTMAQIAGEELDLEPTMFTVQCAPPLAAFRIPGTRRVTGGSGSTRTIFMPLRQLGASARAMLIETAADRLQVPAAELVTEPGRVIHTASGRSLGYGELALEAAARPVPQGVPLRARENFRWINKRVDRLDVHAKSTGQIKYNIDLTLEGMLLAAVKHAPRMGMQPVALLNEQAVLAMPGVHSVHRLTGAVAVTADRWWRARKAVETLQAQWSEPGPDVAHPMPADFSTDKMQADMRVFQGPGQTAENIGNTADALKTSAKTIEATYEAPFLSHAQLEPPSALAHWNGSDGTLELWIPNQAPEMFAAAAAKAADIPQEKLTMHTPMLGGFFGRHFLYEASHPYAQAIALTKATGRPVKVIWSREEEFLRDTFRPASTVRFRAGLDQAGMPVAINMEAISDGMLARMVNAPTDKADSTVMEGLIDRPYSIPNKHAEHIRFAYPPMIGAFRSVGHSFNAFFSESFADEMAEAGGIDPLEWRRRLVKHSPRHQALLESVIDLSGGWKRGPFTAEDGSRRARGLAMASPFKSETATVAEVSIVSGRVRVHDVWVAIDPGSVVNPRIVEAQVHGAVALGLSTALHEHVVYEHGTPRGRNYDGYPILTPSEMPQVHVRIVESGAEMGGIGEPGLPGVPPAVANAVAALTGHRVRSLPMSKTNFDSVG